MGSEVHVDTAGESLSEYKTIQGLPENSWYKAERRMEMLEVEQDGGEVENTTQPEWRNHINTF